MIPPTHSTTRRLPLSVPAYGRVTFPGTAPAKRDGVITPDAVAIRIPTEALKTAPAPRPSVPWHRALLELGLSARVLRLSRAFAEDVRCRTAALRADIRTAKALRADVLALREKLDEPVLYVTKNGKCFHLAGCSALGAGAVPMKLTAVLERGYKPCRRCLSLLK